MIANSSKTEIRLKDVILTGPDVQLNHLMLHCLPAAGFLGGQLQAVYPPRHEHVCMN